MASMTLEECRARNSALDQLLQLIPHWQLQQLAERRIRKGTAMIVAGQRDENLYILLDGVADISREFSNGLRMTYYKVTAGDVVGLYELLGPSITRTATVLAHTDLVALTVPRSTVLEWYHSIPELVMAITGRVLGRLFEANSLLAECSSYNLLRSTVTYLLHVYSLYRCQYGPSYDGPVRIAESRQEMADFLGADVRSINRSVERLKNAQLITIQRGKIHIDAKQQQLLAQEKSSGCAGI